MGGNWRCQLIWGAAVVLGLCLFSRPAIHAEETDSGYPVLTWVTESELKACRSIRINPYWLSPAIQNLKKRPSEKRLMAFVNLLYPYAEMPSDYATILAEFRTDESADKFVIKLPGLQTVTLCVDPQTRIMPSITIDSASTGQSVLSIARELGPGTLLSALGNKLRLEKVNLREKGFSTCTFGKNTVVLRMETMEQPPAPCGTWYADRSTGEIVKQSVEAAVRVCSQEIPALKKTGNFPHYMKSFLSLWHQEKVVLISGTSDIPKYDKKPLNEETAAAIQPFSVTSGEQGMKVIVAYGYQQIGGIVTRYRFTFRPEGKAEEIKCIEVGRGIGDAQYYE